MRKRLTVAALIAGFSMIAESAPAPRSRPVLLSYGPHGKNQLDLWNAEGEGPHPLLVYIHGGAWTGADKSQIVGRVDIDSWLAKGVSVASVDYRYSTDAILPAPVHDAARAVQFLRHQAAELNLDPERIALQGGSAGGCSALWILFHDDLADPSSPDPVLRESTRVSGAYGQFPQTSIDPVVLNDWIGELAAAHSMISKAVGAKNKADLMQNRNRYQPLIDEFSPIRHMDAEDPPLYLTYPANLTLPPATAAAAIHHGMFGIKLKEKADEIGYAKCTLSIPGHVEPEPYANADQFLEAILLGNE
jgi:arylformamidase